MRTCEICGNPFEVGHRPGGRFQKYCSVACRIEASHQRASKRRRTKAPITREAISDRPRQAAVKCDSRNIRFFFAPIENGDNWPVGCAFPMTELRLTLMHGFFPEGARFKYQGLVYTVRGHEAIGPGGRIIK